MTQHALDQAGMVPAGIYYVDAGRTRITFRTRHLFGLATAGGRFEVDGGSVALAQAFDLANAPAVAPRCVAELFVDAASIDTGNAQRDRSARGRSMLDVVTHPVISVRLEDFKPDADGYAATGTLTARGRTAPLEARVVEVRRDGDLARARIIARVDRYANGITGSRGIASRWLDVTVDLAVRLAGYGAEVSAA